MRFILFGSFMLAARSCMPTAGAADLAVLAGLALAAVGAGYMIGSRG
jgi:hypothetical protein